MGSICRLKSYYQNLLDLFELQIYNFKWNLDSLFSVFLLRLSTIFSTTKYYIFKKVIAAAFEIQNFEK